MPGMDIHFLGGATTVTGSQFLLDHGARPRPHRLRDVPGQPERIDPQPDPVRVRPRRARRGPADPRPPRPLRAAAAARQGGLSAARSTRRPAPSSWPRSSCSTRASSTRSSPSASALGEAPPGQGRRRRPPGRGRPLQAAIDAARKRAKATTSAATIEARRRARARGRRPVRAAPSLAARPRGGPARPAAAAGHRPRRAALHGKDAERSLPQFAPLRYDEERRGRAGDPRHVRRRRPHPRLGDHPAARHGARGRRGARHRLLGRPRPARHADPARPDRR